MSYINLFSKHTNQTFELCVNFSYNVDKQLQVWIKTFYQQVSRDLPSSTDSYINPENNSTVWILCQFERTWRRHMKHY